MNVKDSWARVGPLRLHVREWGEPTAQPLLVLPGLGANVWDWDTVAGGLMDLRRVVVLDQRGQGESDWAEEYSFELLRRDVEHLVEVLAFDRFDLLGHSMGANVAYQYVINNPGRIDRLVIIDTPPPKPNPNIEVPPLEHQLSWASLDQALEWTRAQMPLTDQGEVRRAAAHGFRQRDDGRFVFGWDPRLASGIIAQLRNPDPAWWDRLPEISVPTLIVRGTESRVPIDRFHAVVAVLPQASLVEIAGAGHGVNSDRPTELVQAIHEFLSG